MNRYQKTNSDLSVKTQVKASRLSANHNEQMLSERGKGLSVKTQVKAGTQGINDPQHNETLIRQRG